MIKVFKATDTNFTSNGDKIIKPIEATITKNTEEEYLELEAPLEYAEFLIQDNILIADTLTGAKGYRIHNPTRGDVIKVKAPLIYQENQPSPEDRGAVISYGKNIENCEVSENWDDVVTKLTPIGYKGIKLPEVFISVPSPHQKVYEKTIEFELTESLKDDVEVLEDTIEADKAAIEELKNSIATINSKINAAIFAIDSLNDEREATQDKIDQLGTSEVELKEKAVLEELLTSINEQISTLFANKDDYQISLAMTENQYAAAVDKLNTDTADYNDLIVNDLRTQAELYLNANIYPHINYDLQAHLDGIVEIGDTVKIAHERLNIDMLAYVTAYKFDCITFKFTDLQFGTEKATLKSKISGIEQSIKMVSDGVSGASTLIEQLSNQIVLKVDTVTGKVALFKLGSDLNETDILIKADNISLEGLITANGYFKILADGSIEAVNGKFTGKVIAASIVGGSIESENYIPGVSGMKIYLNDGSIETKNFKIGSDNKVTIKDMAVNITTSEQETSVMEFNYGNIKMRLTPSSLKFENNNTGKTLYIYNFASSPRISISEGVTPVVQISSDGIIMPDKYITCDYINCNNINGGASGSFVTADGKAVIVSGGVITQILV